MSNPVPIIIDADIYDDSPLINADIHDGFSVLDGDVGISFTKNTLPTYIGETEFAPTTDIQVVHTKNKSVLDNIIINPIPNNYGLITWDGSVLTVS